MANTATLFLLALAGGFVFAYRCHYTSYLASRVQGQALLLLAAAYAVGLLVLSRLTLTLIPLLYSDPWLCLVRGAWDALAGPLHNRALPTFVGAFLWAPVLAWIVNEFYDRDEASDYVIMQYGGDTEKLLSNNLANVELIYVTLENRQVYIGWPTYTPGLRRDTEDFRILPVLSGFRDEQTLEVDYTTYYPDVLDRVDNGEIGGVQADDLEVVIPLNRVISLGPFSLDIPQEWFKVPIEEDTEE
jgi:hypothetical protein